MGQRIGFVYSGLVHVYGRWGDVEAYIQASNDKGIGSRAVILGKEMSDQSANTMKVLFVENMSFEGLGNLELLFGRSSLK